MKKIIALMLALMLAVTCFAACGKKDGDTKKKYTVGICNYVDDASLNQIVDNIKKQLASAAARILAGRARAEAIARRYRAQRRRRRKGRGDRSKIRQLQRRFRCYEPDNLEFHR